MKIKYVNENPFGNLERAHPTDAGADLRALHTERINPGEKMLVQTGLYIAIPNGFAGFVVPRSGMVWKRDLTVANSPGTVDASYRGEVLVNLKNDGDCTRWIDPGDRIAQLIIKRVELAKFQPVEALNTTVRGAGGHGSTGTR